MVIFSDSEHLLSNAKMSDGIDNVQNKNLEYWFMEIGGIRTELQSSQFR